MKKNDLLTSDVVLSDGGNYGIILRGTYKGDLIKWFKDKNGEIIHKYRSFDMIKDDLTFKTSAKFDGQDTRIVKVYRVTDPHNMSTMDAIKDEYVIWQNIKEVTMAELEEMFGCKVKVIREN